MDRFDNVGRIDDPSDIFGRFEVVGEILPLVSPGSNDDGIFRSPLFFQTLQFYFGRFFRESLIDSFEIFGELLVVFGGHVFEGIANLVNDTELNSVLGKMTLMASGKPVSPSTEAIRISFAPRLFRSVSTCSRPRNEVTTSPQRSEDKIGPFALTQIKSQDLFFPIKSHSKDSINNF